MDGIQEILYLNFVNVVSFLFDSDYLEIIVFIGTIINTLAITYKYYSCAVHDNRIWVCGSRDSPYACDSYDENWVHQAEKNTIYAHSYGSLVSDKNRGLSIIGKQFELEKYCKLNLLLRWCCTNVRKKR